MDTSDADRIKSRDIAFQDIHPNPHQALAAARFLAGVDGVLSVEPISPTLLRISYDVLQTTQRDIEEALMEFGLHLDNRLYHRLKRALNDYTEETLRANHDCGFSDDITCTQKLFARRYELIEHGCRDERPEHWRRYL